MYNETEMYVYVDFGDKLDQQFFNKTNFEFNIANLHKKTPFVQIGNHVFKGKFEDTIGTKIFYEESSELPPENIFRKKTPIHLQYLAKTVKCIDLKWFKMPEQIVSVDPTQQTDLDLSEDYQSVLKKLKNRTLNIEDIIKHDTADAPPKIENVSNSFESLDSTDNIVEKKSVNNIEAPVVTEVKCASTNGQLGKLRNLSKTPLKGMPSDGKMEIDHILSKNSTKNFLILKQMYLQNLSYKDINFEIDIEHIEEHIDIEKSISDGVVNKSYNLSENDLNKLVSMQNFNNLSVLLQLAFLKEQLKLTKQKLLEMTKEESKILDEYGRTAKDKYRMLKTFAKDLWYLLFLKYSETNITK